MNFLGKLLVLINVTVALLLFTLALVFYTNAIDWGWKEPRKAWYDPPEGKKEPVNERIPSELDRRLVALERANDNRERAKRRVLIAQADPNVGVAPVEGKFADNHRFYKAELARINQSKDDKIEVKEVKFSKERLVLAPDQPYGKPFMENPVAGIEKSYAAYLADLEAQHKAVLEVQLKIGDWTQKIDKITDLLNGKRDKDGKVLEPGYHDLTEIEAVNQRKLREEIEFVQPLRVRHLVDADQMRKRREGLEKRLGELGEPVGK